MHTKFFDSRKNSTIRRTHGFTLIEVLVVVSILGLVASVALANLQSAKEKAEIAAGQQFHSSVQRAIGVDTLARWDFDETAGTETLDSSGNDLTGTIVGAIHTPNGMTGSALLFDGNDWVTGTGFPNPGEDQNLTISAWVYPTSLATPGTLIRQGDSTNCTGFQVSVSGGIVSGTSKGLGEPAEVQIIGSPNRTLVNNKWQNLAVEYSGNTFNTYLNGQRIASTVVANGTSNCPIEEWRIGQGFQGIIDSVNVYGTDLSGL